MKKSILIAIALVFFFKVGIQSINATCAYTNWEEVESTWVMNGGTFIMVCPYKGGASVCCVEKETKTKNEGGSIN